MCRKVWWVNRVKIIQHHHPLLIGLIFNDLMWSSNVRCASMGIMLRWRNQFIKRCATFDKLMGEQQNVEIIKAERRHIKEYGITMVACWQKWPSSLARSARGVENNILGEFIQETILAKRPCQAPTTTLSNSPEVVSIFKVSLQPNRLHCNIHHWKVSTQVSLCPLNSPAFCHKGSKNLGR